MPRKLTPLLESLENLQLSKSAASVYVALLSIGPCGLGPLISETGLHRQLIYNAIDILGHEGLVATTFEKGKKVFHANSPKILLERVEQQKRMAENLLPKLEELQSSTHAALQVHVLHGQENFYRNLISVVESCQRGDRIMRIVGGAAPHLFYSTLGNYAEAYQAAVRKAKVQIHIILPKGYPKEQKKTFLNQQKGNRIGELPILSSPTFTRISNDMVTTEIYANEVTIIQIRSPEIARSYLDHFEVLWGQAKECKLR